MHGRDNASVWRTHRVRRQRRWRRCFVLMRLLHVLCRSFVIFLVKSAPLGAQTARQSEGAGREKRALLLLSLWGAGDALPFHKSVGEGDPRRGNAPEELFVIFCLYSDVCHTSVCADRCPLTSATASTLLQATRLMRAWMGVWRRPSPHPTQQCRRNRDRIMTPAESLPDIV